MASQARVPYKGQFLTPHSGWQIVDFNPLGLRLALDTCSKKRRKKVGLELTIQAQRHTKQLSMIIFPVAGTYAPLPEQPKEGKFFYMLEAGLAHPNRRRYFCLVDLRSNSKNPGHIWRLQ